MVTKGEVEVKGHVASATINSHTHNKKGNANAQEKNTQSTTFFTNQMKLNFKKKKKHCKQASKHEWMNEKK